MKREMKANSGFTLIELIIVIIILGILAALAIPQFTPATKDAQVAALGGNLTVMRTAIQLYYHQHESVYPGFNDEITGAAAAAGKMETAFVSQLTNYSNKNGVISTTKDTANYPYGPYLMSRAVPDNPLTDAATTTANIAAVEADNAAGKLTATVGATKGWRYSVLSGEFIANNTTYEGL